MNNKNTNCNSSQVRIIEATKRAPSVSVETKMKTAAYCRVSTDDEDQLKSYDSMVKYYTDKIQENPNWEYVGIYADRAVTGTSTKDRIQFNRMLQDAFDGKIELIITKSISRFARNVLDGLSIVKELRERNIYVRFEEENLDTSTNEGDMGLTMMLAVAENEVRNTSNHVKTGLMMKMKRGELVGFNRCLGYDYDPKEKIITININEAQLVRYIFEQYVDGKGTQSIAKDLNDKGILTIRGNRWGQTSVMSVIKNEKYVGDLCQGKTYTNDPISKRRMNNDGVKNKYYVENHHEAIIDRETWEKAQTLLDSRNACIKRKDGMRNMFTKKYTFSYKLECGFCGHNLSRKSWHGEDGDRYKRIIWHCTNYLKEGKAACPDCKGIEEWVIEKAFVEVFNRMCCNNQEVIDEFLKRVEKSLGKKDDTNEAERVKAELHALISKRQNLVDSMLEGVIDKDVYVIKDAELKGKVSEKEDIINEINNRIDSNQNLKERIIEFRKILSKQEVMTEFNSELFTKLIDKVIVGGINDMGEKDPYKLTFIFKTGLSDGIDGVKKRYKVSKSKKCSALPSNGSAEYLSTADGACGVRGTAFEIGGVNVYETQIRNGRRRHRFIYWRHTPSWSDDR